MKEKTLMRARELKREIEYISTRTLPELYHVHDVIVDCRDRGNKEIGGDFYFEYYFDGKKDVDTHWSGAVFTIENVINFIKIEIEIVTERKKALEKEFEEL